MALCLSFGYMIKNFMLKICIVDVAIDASYYSVVAEGAKRWG